MPTTPRRERRRAKYQRPKAERIDALEQQIVSFTQTLNQHEDNADRLEDLIDALPPAPTDGAEDPHEAERDALTAQLEAEHKAMDTLESGIETTRAKRDAIKAGK